MALSGKIRVPRRSGDDERAPPARDRLSLTLVRENVSLGTGEVDRASPARSHLPLCTRTASSRSAPKSTAW